MNHFFQNTSFNPEDVNLNLQTTDKFNVIKELLEKLFFNHPIIADFNQIFQDLKIRELKGSTGMQNGIAIPHIRTPFVHNFFIALGLHRKGVDFHSIDSNPTHIILLTLVPEDQSDFHLKFLSAVSSMMQSKNFKEKILQSKTKQQAYNLFLQSS